MNKTPPRCFSLAAASLAGLLLFSGCRKETIRVYQIPKEAENPPAAMPGSTPPAAPTAHGPIRLFAPKGWKELPKNSVRAAAYSVPGERGAEALVTVVPLAGSGGTDLANVNRWRRQIGLPPIEREALDRLRREVSVGGEPAALYDLRQPEASRRPESMRILAAALRRGRTAWFFKMIGPDALLEREKTNFVQFLHSARFAASSEPSSKEAPKEEAPPVAPAPPR